MGADFYESFEEINETMWSGIPHIGIGKNTRIRNAIIDKGARVGNNVELINERGVSEDDGDNYHIRDGIIIIPKGAIVPDGTVI